MDNRIIGKRILIIGSGGSGKSTLSKELHKLTDLQLIHLDSEFWQSGWIETPKEQWYEKIKTLVASNEWIIDGNYAGSLDIRLEAADTVIFLDFNRFICTFRILKRYRKYKNKTRPDMADGCPEKMDFEFFKWVWSFNKKVRPQIINKLAEYPNVKQIILRRPKDVKKFLKLLRLHKFFNQIQPILRLRHYDG